MSHYSAIPHFQKALKCFLKLIECTQQLQVGENVVGFEEALGAVEVIKDKIQYRSTQSLLNLARGYFSTSRSLYRVFSGIITSVHVNTLQCRPCSVILIGFKRQIKILRFIPNGRVEWPEN